MSSIKSKINTPKGKSHLPEKICIVCGRPFSWRKKWEKNWEQVKKCSERCRRTNKNQPDGTQTDIR
jgi:hypothetical protein